MFASPDPQYILFFSAPVLDVHLKLMSLQFHTTLHFPSIQEFFSYVEVIGILMIIEIMEQQQDHS